MRLITKTLPPSIIDKSKPLAYDSVGIWPFTEGHGNKAFDLSGYNKTMILYGDTYWNAGNLYFDGSGNDYASAALTSQITYANPFTVIWNSINNTAETSKGLLNIQAAAGDANQICTVYYASGYNGLKCSRKGNLGAAYSAKPANAITQTAWHQFAITCVGGDSVLNLYINGLYSTINNIGTLSDFDSNVVELAKGIPNYYANCQVRYLYLFNRVFTASEIRDFYFNSLCLLKPKMLYRYIA